MSKVVEIKPQLVYTVRYMQDLRMKIMPIVDMKFEDGIFSAREYGRIEKADAKAWVEKLSHHCLTSLVPVVALVDALEVKYISTEARQIFVRASKIPNFKCSAVAAEQLITVQTARVIARMSQKDHTYIFATLKEARAFALDQIDAGV